MCRGSGLGGGLWGGDGGGTGRGWAGGGGPGGAGGVRGGWFGCVIITFLHFSGGLGRGNGSGALMVFGVRLGALTLRLR
jgi:hypothetical protein